MSIAPCEISKMQRERPAPIKRGSICVLYHNRRKNARAGSSKNRGVDACGKKGSVKFGRMEGDIECMDNASPGEREDRVVRVFAQEK